MLQCGLGSVGHSTAPDAPPDELSLALFAVENSHPQLGPRAFITHMEKRALRGKLWAGPSFPPSICRLANAQHIHTKIQLWDGGVYCFRDSEAQLQSWVWDTQVPVTSVQMSQHARCTVHVATVFHLHWRSFLGAEFFHWGCVKVDW